MYEQTFKNLGLNQNEAEIYEMLLDLGPSTLQTLKGKTEISRGNIYNTLYALRDRGLVTEKKSKGKTIYQAESPDKLFDLLANKEQEFFQNKKNLANILPNLKSMYVLGTEKPVVRYYEGAEGIKKVLEDTLTSTETIYQYSDIEAIVKYIDKINKDYVKKREKFNLKKKAILIDSPFTRNYLKGYHTGITENKFIDHKLFPFNSLMQIYDGKIVYVTLTDKSKIGVIIEDKNIYKMHKSIFEFNWQYAKSYEELSAFSKTQ